MRGGLPTASLAAGAVLLAASAAYGLSAGGAGNVKDLGVGQSTPPGTDTVAQATPTPPPATTSPAPDTVPQATPAPPPASTTSTPAPKPSKPAAKAKAPATTPSTPSTSPSQPTSRPHRHHTTKPPRHHHTSKPPPSWVADGDPPYGAVNYSGGSKPYRAIDDNTKTAWMTRSSGNGVIVDTGAAQPYTEVGIVTSTPGFSVSVYSSDDNKRSGDLSADGWKLENRSSVAKYQTIRIKPKQKRYLLIYVTKLPSGQSKAAINEIKLIF
jgi:hypothetical protein